MIQTRTLTAIVALLVASATVSAQAVPAKFRWQGGQVLTYRTERTTTEAEVVGGSKVESSLKLTNTKRWQVLSVDAMGIATIQQTLTALRVERTTGTGTTAVFDSAKPDQSDPPMREQLGKYVGAPLVVMRVDSFGKVIEVTKSTFISPSRYENELPFTLMLPAEGIQPNQMWQRNYAITLDPPLGTGEKYPAMQSYQCRAIAGAQATVAIKTNLKTIPEDKGDQVKMLQFLPEGEAVFDVQSGCLLRARMTVNQEVKGHHGDDSSYSIQVTHLEELMPN